MIVRYLTATGTANTYSGNTTISAGTLALASGSLIASTPLISIAGGATYDVTAATVAAATLGAGQTLQTSGSTSSATLATAAGHGLTLNAVSPLKFTAFAPGYVPLTLSGAGTLTLGASSPVTVTLANGGTKLPVGSYKLIAKGASGTVAQVPGGALTVNGDGANGAPSLRITSGELWLDVSVASANKLVMKTAPSSSVTAGGAFSTQPAVYVEDAYGNVVTTDTSTVTATVQTGSGPLTGTLTAVVSGGVATFSGLAAPTLAQSGLKLTFTDASLTSAADITSITVTPGTLDHFAISAIASPQTAGVAITGIAITAQDANNNTATGYTGAVAYGGTAGITGTSAAFASGQLTGVSVTPLTAGTSLTFLVSGSGMTGTATIATVYPGALSQLVMNPATLAAATVGTSVSSGLTSITAKDANGNVCSSGPNDFTGTVTFGGTAGATGTSAAFTHGVLSAFPSLTPTVAGNGKTLTATSAAVVGTTTITTVGKAEQTIAFTLGSPVMNTAGSLTLAATASSGLVVSYSSSDPLLASVSGDTLTIHRAGSVNVTASQAGNGNYNAAAAVAQPLVITGLVAGNDGVNRQAGSTGIKIPLASLLTNDGVVNGSGVLDSNGVTITGVAPGSGNSVSLVPGKFVLFTPSDPAAIGALTFTYTASYGAATAPGVVTVTTIEATPFKLDIIGPGPVAGPTYDSISGKTSVTLEFAGVPNQTYKIQYSTDLSVWTGPFDFPSGATGTFNATFEAPGNQTTAWRSMSVRATR